MTLDESYETYVHPTDDNGIFESEDEFGTSYYFRGNVTNNYVKFGQYTEDAYAIYDSTTGTSSYATSCGEETNCTQIASVGDYMYWRIIRINGDGTIRMIYDGTSAHANDEASENRIIGYSTFNKSYNDNAYVGYMYGTVGGATYEETHANINDSSIKTTIDRWYSKYLNTNYGSYIADAIYCNDRKVVTEDNKYKMWWEDDTKVAGTGIGTSETMYGTWNRLESEDNYYNFSEVNPTLKCEQENDRFTVNNTIEDVTGNGKLTYPIGMITADETIFAGGTWFSNNAYYLYSGYWYWTMSSSGFGDSANGFNVIYAGNAPSDFNVNYNYGARSVISLKSDAIKSGTGTTTDPFTISS